jgi:ERF superfamily
MNPETEELTLGDDRRLSPAHNVTPAELMQAVINKGITPENVAVLEKLIGLHERMELRDAEKAFNGAFVALQKDMPAIKASEAVPDKNGNVKYHFAPYEAIMEEVKPLLQKHGFTVSFSMDFREGRIIQSCTLSHLGGHSRTNQFMARVGNGPPGSSEAQADGAASTYAKRFALCNALNIVCDYDTDGAGQDARNEGAPISWDQVEYLREQVRETKSDEAAFLRFAGVNKYAEIGTARYPQLVAALQKKAHK